MKRIISILSVLLLAGMMSEAIAQAVSGTVRDVQTQEPLEGASVVQLETRHGTSTGPDGEFSLELLSGAPAVLEVRYLGYETRRIETGHSGEQGLSIYLFSVAYRGTTIFVDDVRVDDEAPVTQTTIRRADIEKDNIGQDPIYTLERYSPSILTHSDSGTRFANYGYMRLRGMDQTRINMTLNGIPLNDMIDQGVFFSNFNDFGNSIQSAQVQRGVGTSTHGTASYAGSINFESRNIVMDDPSTDIRFSRGAFNSYRLSSEINTGSIDRFGFYTRFSKTGSDGYRYNSGTESASFFFSGGYFGSHDIFRVTAFTGQTKNELAYTPVPLDQIRRDPRSNNIEEHDRDDFSQQFLQLQYGRFFNDRISLTSSLYYGGAGGGFPVGFRDENGQFIQQVFGLENDHYGLQATLQYSDDERINVSGGIHTYRFDRINREHFEPESEDIFYSDRSQKDEFSTFMKASYRRGSLEVYGDLQFRYVALALNPDLSFLEQQGVASSSVDVPVREWTFLSPKVGIAWFFSDRTSVYASYGRSGREPTRHDILGATNINPANLEVVSNPESVRAEYVNDFEGGLRVHLPAFSAKLNGFYMQFTDEISPTGAFIPEGFIQLRENIAESYRAGIEAEWQWRPYRQFALNGNATRMTTNITSFSPGESGQVYRNVESILSPNWLVNSSVTYMPIDRLDLVLSGRYMSEAYLELTNREDLTLPSFFVANLELFTRIRDNMSASLKVHNLFDERYFTNGSPLDTNFDGNFDSPGYIVQPPRHLFMEIQVSF